MKKSYILVVFAITCMVNVHALMTPELARESEWSIALEAENLKKIKELVAQGQNINKPIEEEGNKTPLMILAELGNAEGVKYLLERGADINKRDNSGYDVFYYAQRAPLFKRAIIQQLLLDQKRKLSPGIEEEWVQIKTPTEEIEEEWETID